MSSAEDQRPPGAVATAEPEPVTQVEPSDPGQLGDTLPGDGEPTPERTDDDDPELQTEGQLPAQLPEGWQDHEEIKAHGQTKYNEGRGSRERELRKEMTRREARYDQDIQTATERAGSQHVVQSVLQIAQDGLALDTEEGIAEFNKLLRNNGRWADVFIGAQAAAAEARTIRDARNFIIDDSGLSEEAAGELKDFESDLVWKTRHGEVSQGQALRELVTESVKHFKKLGAVEEGQRRDKLEREMTGAQAQADERRGGGSPPATPRGGGGKKRDVTIKDIKKMTREQIMALPEKDRDAAMKAS